MDGMKDILKQALETFAICEERESTNRKDFVDDIKFSRLSEQWPKEIKKLRDSDPTGPRPCLTINKVAPVVRQIVNDARMNRPAITVRPVDGKADKETAEVMTGLIRNIEQMSDADIAYDTAVDNAVSGGFGYFRVNLDYAHDLDPAQDLQSFGPEAFEMDIVIERIINPLSVYGDPNSKAATSEDWNEAFVFEDMPTKEFEKKYPKAKGGDFQGAAGDSQTWLNEKTTRIAEYWVREKSDKAIIAVSYEDTAETVILDAKDYIERHKEIEASGGKPVGPPRKIPCYKVTQYILTGSEVLEEKPWPGKYIPLIPVYGDEVFCDGKRHLRSVIRDAKDANRMFNYWRTTETELIALAPKAPFIGEQGAFDVDANWETANKMSHPYLEYKQGAAMPQRQPFTGIPAGALQAAMNAADDIKATTGVYDASLGARSNETSGRAINARQREGDVSNFHFIDNLTRAIRHAGRVVLDLIPKVYSTPRMVRVLGEDGAAENAAVNGAQPIEEQQENKGRRFKGVYDLRVGRYDLAVTAGPGFTTRREEAAQQMIDLIRNYPDAAPLIGDILAKSLDWPGADEIAKRLEAMLPPQARGEDGDPRLAQMQEAMQQMAQQLAEAGNDAAQQDRKLDIEEYKAETERMAALQPAMGPEQIQAIVMQTLQQLSDELPQGEGPPTGFSEQPPIN